MMLLWHVTLHSSFIVALDTPQTEKEYQYHSHSLSRTQHQHAYHYIEYFDAPKADFQSCELG
jgi:hypothetical protein